MLVEEFQPETQASRVRFNGSIEPACSDFAGRLFGAQRKPAAGCYFMSCCKCKNFLVDSDLYCPICGAPAVRRQIPSMKGVLLGIGAIVVIVCLVEFIF
jgi:hypothetical protein